MSTVGTTAVIAVALGLSLLSGCGQNAPLPTVASPNSGPPLSNSNIAPTFTAALPPPDSACALLSTSTMVALVDGHSIETYVVERRNTADPTDKACSFQPNTNYAPGLINVWCGPSAAATYADWSQSSKGSLLLGSEPAPMYGVNGTHSHGFIYKVSGSSGKGCLIEIAGLGNPSEDALKHALAEAFRNPRI